MKFLLFRIWYSTHLYAAHETFLVNQIWHIHFKLATSTFEHIISVLHFAWIHIASKVREVNNAKNSNRKIEMLKCFEILMLSYFHENWLSREHFAIDSNNGWTKVHKITPRFQWELAIGRWFVYLYFELKLIVFFFFQIKVYFKFYSYCRRVTC